MSPAREARATPSARTPATATARLSAAATAQSIVLPVERAGADIDWLALAPRRSAEPSTGR
jgi:hypothetical protein